MTEGKIKAQAVWGIVLCLAGCGVFYRTHQLAETIESLAGRPATALFIRICLYIMGILLLGGGLKKIYHYCFGDTEKLSRQNEKE